MNKIQGLEEWDFTNVAADAQVVQVSVFAAYPKLLPPLLALAPLERRQYVTQKMQEGIEVVLETNKLSHWKLLRSGGPDSRCYGVHGEVKVVDVPALASLSEVEYVRVEATNGRKKRLSKPRRRPSFFCVKMTVAIQIEGRKKGMQRYEERYVLYKGYSEAEAIQKAELAALAYQKAYLNSDGLLVRWKVESIDSAYEVVTEANTKDFEGAEVFSVLKTRKLTPNRVWSENEKIDEV
jgi:hypothetical protein